jgi:hypothetical protein
MASTVCRIGRVALVMPSVVRRQFEQLHDLTTSIDSELPRLDTTVFVVYKLNSGFTSPNAATFRARFGSRFDVEVSQALPVPGLRVRQWQMIIAVRNCSRRPARILRLDELQVVRPPKHVLAA